MTQELIKQLIKQVEAKKQETTPAKFADTLGYTERMIRNILTGSNLPSVRFLGRLCVVYPDLRESILTYLLNVGGSSTNS
jgi:transcriptional regulator with XRE-family HTH domain